MQHSLLTIHLSIQRATTKSVSARKVQKLLVGYILAGLLAFWSIGAMWSHINGLQSQYGWMMKIGILAGEFAVFVLITWHVLRRWVWTRVYCLIGATALAIAIIIHVAAVIKYDSNKVEGKAMIAAVSEGQAKITQGGSAGIVKGGAEGASALRAAGASSRQVSRAVRDANAKAAQVATDANKQFTEAAAKIEQQKKAENFLSVEYLSGPMYAVIFCLALVIIGIGYGVMEFGSPYEDDDEDGIPNYAERDHRLYNPEQAADYWQSRGIEPGRVYYRGERDYRVLPDGRREVIRSTYSPSEVGQIWPAEIEQPEPSANGNGPKTAVPK